jgi:tetratricopeptide (TPR) repeat protein
MATPSSTPPRREDTIPLYDGSYYLIVTRVVNAVKRETGVANKLKGASREARAIGSHTKRRVSALSLAGKVLAAVLLVGLGAGVAAGAWFYVLRPDPTSLRTGIRAHLAAGELVSARRGLEALRVAIGDLTPRDRAELAEPLRARLEAQSEKLRREIQADARRGRHERALATLDELEPLETDARWAAFTRAEILRVGKLPGARAAYGRFVERYPESDQADDALFWQALIDKDEGRTADARAKCQALLARYPKSNFRSSGERMLAELADREK